MKRRLPYIFAALFVLAACDQTATVAIVTARPPAEASENIDDVEQIDDVPTTGDAPTAALRDAPGGTLADAPTAEIDTPTARDGAEGDPWLDSLRDTLADVPRRDAVDDLLDSIEAPADAAHDAIGDRPLHVVVISDLNSSYGSTDYRDDVVAAVDRIIGTRPDLVLTTGDMVAGQRAGLNYRAMWSAFHATVTDPLAAAGIPLAVTPGNHDASEYPGFVTERAIFVDEWAERRPDVVFLDDSNYPLRYSFRMGPALFISLDSTGLGPLDSEQMSWLQAQLANHAALPVKIVFGHVPLYPFTEGRETQIIGDAVLEDMLNHYGVDAFISGHHHAYYPGRRDNLRLVGMPCLGDGARRLIGTDYVSERAIVEFWITPHGIAELDGYGGISMNERIERYTLPEWVGEGATMILRDDLYE